MLNQEKDRFSYRGHPLDIRQIPPPIAIVALSNALMGYNLDKLIVVLNKNGRLPLRTYLEIKQDNQITWSLRGDINTMLILVRASNAKRMSVWKYLYQEDVSLKVKCCFKTFV